MKILTSMTTTTLLLIILLIANLFATLTSICLNINYTQMAAVANIEQDKSAIEQNKSENLEIIAEKTSSEQMLVVESEAESTPQIPPPPPFHRLILQAAQQHALDPALIRAVIMAESSCNPNAVSNRGAEGLMQLMPRTAAELGVENSFDPEQNINGGAKYLRKLMDRFDNDVQLALAAYNAGSRYVRKYNGVPPFRATRLYIKKVIKYRTLYQQKPFNDNQMV
jgi:soluble lytic murein transglycosylase-like protein